MLQRLDALPISGTTQTATNAFLIVKPLTGLASVFVRTLWNQIRRACTGASTLFAKELYAKGVPQREMVDAVGIPQKIREATTVVSLLPPLTDEQSVPPVARGVTNTVNVAAPAKTAPKTQPCAEMPGIEMEFPALVVHHNWFTLCKLLL